MYEHAYYQNKEGALDAFIWEGVVANLQIAKGTSGYEAFWRDRGWIFSQEFQDFFNNAISEPDKKGHEPYKAIEDEVEEHS
jgi:hypothetical protein